MWHYIHHFTQHASGAIRHLDREHWILICVGAVVFGAICLRGFGSRTTY